MRTLARHALNLLIAVALLLSVCRATPAHAQEGPDQFIARLLQQMTPEAKVGQLFVVSFPGMDVSATS